MEKPALLTTMKIPADTNAAGLYEERQTAIARWCKPTVPETKRVSTQPPSPNNTQAATPSA